MKYQINLLYLIGLIALNIAAACSNPDLNGHWHVESAIENEQILGREYVTIDIFDDTLGIIGQDVFDGAFEGRIDFKKEQMRFGGECHVLDFRFEAEEDILYLNQILYAEPHEKQFVGRRCNDECCDKQKDYFSHIPIEIDLPSIVDTTRFIKHEKSSIDLSYFLGKSNIDKQEEQFSLIHSFYKIDVKADSIQYYEAKSKIKIPENRWEYAKRIFYFDKDVSKNEVDKLCIEFQKMGVVSMIFALREQEISQSINVWYKKINIEDIIGKDTSMTWGAFITQNDSNG